MATAPQTRIHTPLRRRFRIWRQRFLPVTVWLGAIVLIAVLAERQHLGMTVLPGVVELHEVSVSPLSEGLVGGIAVDVLDEVANGQVVALMDDTLVRGELIVAQAELGQLRAALADAERIVAETRVDQATEARRFSLDYAQAKLDRLERWAEQESDRVSLRRLESLAERQRLMVESGVFDTLTQEQTQLEYESLKRRVAESDTVLKEAETQIAEAEARLAEFQESSGGIPYDAAIAPVAENIAVQEAVIQGITDRLSLHVLRAPIQGRVTRIFYRPGETVAMGEPLMTIVDNRSRRAMAYVDEQTAVKLSVGTELEVYSQAEPERVVMAKVLKVGGLVEPVPLDASGQTHGMVHKFGRRTEVFPQYLRTSTVALRWGRPVLLGELPEGAFTPGQAVMVRYTPVSRFPFLDSLL